MMKLNIVFRKFCKRA